VTFPFFVAIWEVGDSMQRIQKGALLGTVGSNDGVCGVKKRGLAFLSDLLAGT